MGSILTSRMIRRRSLQGHAIILALRPMAFRHSASRSAFTVAYPQAVYVLHVFKKKSASGIATPKPDKDTIMARLKAAEEHYRRTYG
jgi:phage-related protein